MGEASYPSDKRKSGLIPCVSTIVLILVFSHLLEQGALGAPHAEIVLPQQWGQAEARWCNDVLGNNPPTKGASGRSCPTTNSGDLHEWRMGTWSCAVTSLAMIYNFFSPGYTDPGDLNKRLTPRGFGEGNGNLNWGYLALPPGVEHSTSGDIDSELAKGPVLFKVKYLKWPHFVVAIGKSGDTYSIVDPADGQKHTMKDGYFGSYIRTGVHFFRRVSNPPSPDVTPPGGVWISPSQGETTSAKVHLAVHAYDNQGGSGVHHVSFTAWWPALGPKEDPWRIVCSPTSMTHDDVYECDWDLAKTPPGAIAISFDVYDNAGNRNLSPNGERTIFYFPASTATVTRSPTQPPLNTNAPTETRRPTLITTSTPVPTITASPTPTDTRSQTATPTDTRSATPIPTSTPTATGILTPSPTEPCTAPPIEDLSFNPSSATVGTTVNVHAKATWNSCFRAMRLKVDGNIVYELGAPEFNFSWNTSGYGAGDHTIRLEVAAQGDNSWSSPSVREASYTLSATGLSKPTLVRPSNGALLAPGTDVTLEWNSVSGAAEYLVEIWGGQYGGNHATPCGWQSGTNCHIGTISAGNVLWRVKARDSSGNESPWSDEWNFTPQ